MPCHDVNTQKQRQLSQQSQLHHYHQESCALLNRRMKSPERSARQCRKARQRPRTPAWRKPPLCHYSQLWSRLDLMDGIVCRQYAPSPSSDVATVPILPTDLREQTLHCNHSVSSAGHQVADKNTHRLRQEAYWVNMASDVYQHCHNCVQCQRSKLPAPTRAPKTSIPIGRHWQMIAVDILEVPVSYHNNRYQLVVQHYFTKWAEAIPLPDQTAVHITCELVKIFSTISIPDPLHSDQGRNFESTILHQTLDAFGVNKSRTSTYHPQGDGMIERFNRSLLQLLHAYVCQ